MLKFQFDISGVVNEFSLSKEDVRSLSNLILDRLVDEYMFNWENIVDSTLDSTRDEYKKGMYSDRLDDMNAIIGLTSTQSKLAMMIEVGANVFDEKEGFSKSLKKKKRGKDGWYLTIPFRHATSSEIMKQFTKQGEGILEFLKGGSKLSQSSLPTGYDEPLSHIIPGSTIKYEHKSPIYEGLHRTKLNSTEKEKRGGYFTFRRVSDNSDSRSWFHPGFEAKNLMDRALNESKLDQVVDTVLQEFLNLKFG